MTDDYHQRTRLHAVANTVGQIAWLIVPWFWWIMTSDVFEDSVQGASVLGYCVGGGIILMGIVPAIFCREKTLDIVNEEDSGSKLSGLVENTRDFFGGIATTLKCKPFVKLCAATYLVFNGYQLGVSFSLYCMIYYVFGGGDGADSAAGGLNGRWGTLTAICTLVVIPLTAFISEKLGKRRTFIITISLSIIGYAMKWIGYNPDHPNWLLASCPFVAFGTGSLFTLMGSMISDVCDYDELHSHERREGIFGAIYWWMVKVGMAIAGLMTGYLLSISGFDVELGADQSEQTLFWLRSFDVVIPIATSLLAIAIMWTYRLSETEANSIRAQLEERRGVQGS